MPIDRRHASKPSGGTPIDPAGGLARGLIVAFGLNDGSPSLAADAAGSLTAPAVGGISLAGGPSGGALAFDGATGYLGPFGTPSTLSFVQNTLVFTLAARFRLASTSARSSILSTIGVATATRGFLLIYENVNTTAGLQALRLFVANGTSGTPEVDARTANNLVADTTTWHHVAVTGGGPGSTIAFYLDGRPVATTYNTAFTSLSSGDSGGATLIGSANTTIDRPFNGSIDHVMAWNRTLSAAEVGELARNPWQVYRPRPYYALLKSAAASPRFRRTLYGRAGSRGVA